MHKQPRKHNGHQGEQKMTREMVFWFPGANQKCDGEKSGAGSDDYNHKNDGATSILPLRNQRNLFKGSQCHGYPNQRQIGECERIICSK